MYCFNFIKIIFRINQIKKKKPLWITNSAAFGGGEENLLPMWTNVSSLIPVGVILSGSLPSKKPDQGESSQSLYLICVSLPALTYDSSQILSYLSRTSLEKIKNKPENYLDADFTAISYQMYITLINTLTSSALTTPSEINFSAYLSRTGLVALIVLYMRGCVNIGSSISLWPLRR